MRNLTITICFLGLLIAGSTNAAVHYVPTDYSTIQDAIDACVDSDTVVVKPGTYWGHGNYNISLKGKAITVQSTDPGDPQVINTTVIDCQGKPSTRGFVFQSGETSDSKVAGFKITNGNTTSFGGGIYCYNNSSPTISNCVITANSAVIGGAIAVGNTGSRPAISGCTITANSTLVGGGAIYCIGSSPTIESCIIAGNSAPRGGAIYSHGAGRPVIANCTISTNAALFAGGIYCFASSNLEISNSILWGNTAMSAPEMLVGNVGAPATVGISYCDIQGLDAGIVVNSGSTVNCGQGNINLDPMFVSPGQMDSSKVYTEGDYHLLGDSPCIDTGGPVFLEDTGLTDTDIDGDPRLSGAGVDIGADEVVTAESIEAIVKVTPKTLNLTSNGNWITCTVSLGDNYDIGDVVLDSITLNDELEPVRAQIDEVEQKLLIKFDREETQDMLSTTESPALMTVSGKLTDGTDFEGDDTIEIVTSKGKK